MHNGHLLIHQYYMFWQHYGLHEFLILYNIQFIVLSDLSPFITVKHSRQYIIIKYISPTYTRHCKQTIFLHCNAYFPSLDHLSKLKTPTHISGIFNFSHKHARLQYIAYNVCTLYIVQALETCRKIILWQAFLAYFSDCK